jgi:hypothetical protein
MGRHGTGRFRAPATRPFEASGAPFLVKHPPQIKMFTVLLFRC